jgi:hypothetical protein
MTTMNEQSNSRVLTLSSVLIVFTAVCFLVRLAAARPVLSRSSQPAPIVSAQVQSAATVNQSPDHKIAKPRAGKPKIVKDI